MKKGQKLAGTRIIPLVIEQEKMDAMQAAAGPEPILNVLPFRAKKFAVIPTGSEVFKLSLIHISFSRVRADSFTVEMAKLTVLCSISSCISITSSAESRV